MKIAIVVPCYNEEEMLPETTRQLLGIAERLKTECLADATLLYVDDGSRDRTWELIRAHAAENPCVHGLKLAHNRGHQQALWAGLDWASEHADAAISIDADLQDDVEAILSMVREFQNGKDIVYGVRKVRTTDTWFKRVTAQGFYRFVKWLGGDILYNHADFRLMSRRALKALQEFPERNMFLRGMVYSLGFPHSVVYYDRRERLAGESKYPLGKMLSFALDGITSFSVKPLRFIVYLGLFFILIALAAIVYALVSYFQGHVVPGWASLLVSLWFIGGAILLAVGTIGEYVGKIYSEVKRRPRYFIEQSV
ncbi:MAG: glycosyltransferase family 2 protein [Alloprevotella sp.]|nr:glycosyltransferase family 2 protein [Alloprevotella sp.]